MKFLLRMLDDFKKLFTPYLQNYFKLAENTPPIQTTTTLQMIERLKGLTLRAGKRIRPALLYYTHQGFTGENNTEVLKIAVACELMQSFLIIHDDVMDEAKQRRGGQTLHYSYLNDDSRQRTFKQQQRYVESMAIISGNLAGYL